MKVVLKSASSYASLLVFRVQVYTLCFLLLLSVWGMKYLMRKQLYFDWRHLPGATKAKVDLEEEGRDGGIVYTPGWREELAG